MTEELWSDWIEHDGKGCPLPDGLLVWTSGFLWNGEPHEAKHFALHIDPAWNWVNYQALVAVGDRHYEAGKIIRYRYRVTRAGLDLIADASEPLVPQSTPEPVA